jgi:hypothetical protein
MEPEKAVEIDGRLGRAAATGLRNRDLRAQLVIGALAGTTMFSPSTAPRWKIVISVFLRP